MFLPGRRGLLMVISRPNEDSCLRMLSGTWTALQLGPGKALPV